jgi:hypothetical protein
MQRLMILTLAAALVAGCGNGSPGVVDTTIGRYANALTRATNEYRASLTELPVPDGADAGEVVGGAAVTMWSYIAVVTSLRPPDEVDGAHRAYVDALEGSANYMNDAALALEGVALEDMPAVLESRFGSTAAALGRNVTAACVELERVTALSGIGIQLGCEG